MSDEPFKTIASCRLPVSLANRIIRLVRPTKRKLSHVQGEALTMWCDAQERAAGAPREDGLDFTPVGYKQAPAFLVTNKMAEWIEHSKRRGGLTDQMFFNLVLKQWQLRYSAAIDREIRDHSRAVTQRMREADAVPAAPAVSAQPQKPVPAPLVGESQGEAGKGVSAVVSDGEGDFC